MCPKLYVPFEYFAVGHNASSTVICVICNTVIHAGEATIGIQSQGSTQYFGCTKHLTSRAEWLSEWVTFLLRRVSVDKQQNESIGKKIFMESRVVQHRSYRMSDIALHLPLRLNLGSSVIYIHNPTRYLAVLRKHWIKIMRSLERERASTLNIQRRKAIETILESMDDTVFTFHSPDKKNDADIYLLAPEKASALPEHAKTVFICDWPSPELRQVLLGSLPGGSALIEYVDVVTLDLPKKPPNSESLRLRLPYRN
jgi:hypothetical protein